MTIWLGALSLATETTRRGRFAADLLNEGNVFADEAAAMAPWPSGTASCMYLPRKWTVRTASLKEIVPAWTSAEYSPRNARPQIGCARRLQHSAIGAGDGEDCRLGDLGCLSSSSVPLKQISDSESPGARRR